MSDAMVSGVQKLVRMANQIAQFFAAQPRPEAVAGIADHLTAFWTPKMRREIVAFLENGGEGLAPLTREAVERLRS